MIQTIDLPAELQSRGLKPVSWRADRFGWWVPARNLQLKALKSQFRRSRQASKPGDQRFYWEKGARVTDHPYYVHEPTRFKTAISHSERLLITNGATSVEALAAAGIYQVVSSFGESRTPADIVDFAREHVGKDEDGRQKSVSVTFWADLDDTGMKAAIKCRDAFRGSGIAFKAINTSGILNKPGADAADLWEHAQFDQARFLALIKQLPTIILPDYQPPRPKRDGEFHTDDKLVRELLQYYEQKHPRLKKRGSWLDHVSCPDPMHHDKNPSASFDTVNGITYCHVCGKGHSPKQAAQWLGIELPAKRRLHKPGHRIDTKINLGLAKPDATVNSKFVADIDWSRFANERVILIDSAKGTGKTHHTMALMQSTLDNGGNALYVTPYRAPTIQVEAGLKGFISYDDRITTEFLQSAPGVICTLKSIHLVKGRKFDLIVLDEITHVLNQHPTKLNTTRQLIVMVGMLAAAGKVVMMGAMIRTQWLAAIRDIYLIKPFMVKNAFQRKAARAYLYQSDIAMMNQALRIIAKNKRKGKPIFIFTASPKYTRIWTELVAMAGVSKDHILRVHHYTMDEDHVRRALRDTENVFPKYDVIIYTTAMGVGTTYSGPCAAVIGHLNHPWLSQEINSQSIERARHPDQILLWHHRFDLTDLTISPDEIMIDSYEMASLLGAIPPEKSWQISDMHSKIKAAENEHHIINLAAFAQYVKDAGHKTERRRAKPTGPAKDRFHKARDIVAESDKKLTLDLPALSRSEVTDLEKAGKMTEQVQFQELRGQIEYGTGQPINEMLYDVFRQKTNLGQLKTQALIGIGADYANRLLDEKRRELDRGQRWLHLTKSERELYDGLIQFMRIVGNLDHDLPDEEIYDAYIKAIVAGIDRDDIEKRLKIFIGSFGDTYRRVFSLPTDKRFTNQPFNEWKRINKRLGIFVTRKRHTTRANRAYYFIIDKQKTDERRAMACVLMISMRSKNKTVSQTTIRHVYLNVHRDTSMLQTVIDAENHATDAADFVDIDAIPF